MKKILSALIITVLLIGMLPTFALPAAAASSGKTGDCTWSLKGTTLTISGKGATGSYTDETPPWNCSSLKKIVIGNNVTQIDDGAFWNCKNLTSIQIGNKVQNIGWASLGNCKKLKSITIPKSVTYISLNAFDGGEKLTSVFYQGTKKEKAKIYIDDSNESLLNATWYYNSCIQSAKHIYSGNCDASCNKCGKKRTAKAHRYSKTVTTKASLTRNGVISNKCKGCGATTGKTTAIPMIKSVKLSTTAYTYNGKIKTPNVIVKDSKGKTLKKNTDYTVTYASGRKNVGTYKVTIKMKGMYSGTRILTFKINPAKTTVSKLTAGKKNLTVSITKKTAQVTGYQVQYSTSKSFTKATTKTISNYKTTKYTLKNLTAKKTYYVRVRTYKKVGKTTYYSGWSTYKYMKTK